VTHDQEEALAVSDRIVVMDRGRIAQIGTPADLYERPATPFIADFIGDANLIRGTVEQGVFTAPGLSLPVIGPDGPATLSIRPERITLAPGGPDRVVTATYLGSRMEYSVAAAVGEMLVSRPIFEPRLNSGQDVSLSITHTDVSRVA
jgi:iron(III) transport system ATP-binding protein